MQVRRKSHPLRVRIGRLLGIRRWRVVSTYTGGDRILEASVAGWRRDAEKVAQQIREFRDDQDELPRVTVEVQR